MTENSSIEVQRVLDRMRVPGQTHLYVLGCFEKRITLYTQQVRALNLIYSLNHKFKKSGSSVAVIGAGAGGLTAAAAAAVCGCQVSLFDVNTKPLDLIGPSRLRWLHPHIYEWPNENSENVNAGLPLLDWDEGLAIDVVEKLREKWREIIRSYPIEVHCCIENLVIDSLPDGKFLLRWNGPGSDPTSTGSAPPSVDEQWGTRVSNRMRIKSFDIVILAVGFGKETTTKEFPTTESYWHEDNIDRDDRYTRSSVSRVLVSGTGDGGLIDLLRYSFRGFRHERILKEFQNKWLVRPSISVVKERIMKIEADAWERLKRGEAYLPYLNLDYRELADSLVLSPDVSLRRNIQPVLTGKASLPLDLQAAPLNRFLFSLTDAQYIRGPIVRTKKDKRGENFIVEFEDGREEIFDDVVIRHGPVPALEKYFPEIWAACEDLRKRARTSTDPTREPLPYDKFYRDRLKLTDDLTRPVLIAQSAEDIEKVIPDRIPLHGSSALERYREAFLDTTLQSPEV